MIWKTATRPDYPNGTNKIVPKFAWLPTYIQGDMIWLWRYQVIFIYEHIQHKTKIANQDVIFTTTGWVEVSKRLIPKIS